VSEYTVARLKQISQLIAEATGYLYSLELSNDASVKATEAYLLLREAEPKLRGAFNLERNPAS
jgi:hypothetical protein